MDDLEKYIEKRKKSDPQFAKGFEEGFEEFKIGVMLRQAREEAGLSQEEVAQKIHTQRTAISRIENHAEDIKLSTLQKVASAVGKHLKISLA
ncbi:MAG TPA: transcriptional regulator [Candidatus Omnitrophica bacterium]|nr:MAG: transcriptional regulator [Omnitrophica WOR_2 bacterium GWA2_45_18]HBR15403.1 transcriptional regulator [Candidatus Omnitrophota bacterium]